MVPLEQGSFSIFDYGKGPVILLLHGFPDTKEVWKNQVIALANAGYRVIAPDLRGRCASWSTKKWPLGKYLIELESIDKLGQTVKDVALTTLYS
ncbi:MAG: alpha/beta fold hydrolase [Maribacter sp.]|nr:alpha/beta fold hydrolase [Maribacter sp.]